MMNRILVIGVGLLLVGVANFATAVDSTTSVKILDDNSIEFVAKSVCGFHGKVDWQIARLDTIDRLVKYFEDPTRAKELDSCSEKHLDTLKRLQRLVKASQDNVCSDAKIDLIEDFHNDFLSKWPLDKTLQKLLDLEAPRLLVLFFMQYTYQVAETCKSSLINRLKSNERGELKLEDGKTERLDRVVKDFFSKNASGSSNTIHGITLIWRFSEKANRIPNSDYFTKPTAANGYKRATYLSSEADKIIRSQEECLHQLKPIYGKLLLPVIRLIDLGYYLEDEPFAMEYAQRPTLRRLVGTTLICEGILPARVVQDDSIKPGRMVLLTKHKAEPHNLKEVPAESKISENNDQKISLKSLRTLPTVSTDNMKLIKRLKNNIRKHEAVFMRAVLSLTDKIKSSVGKLFCGSSIHSSDFYPIDMMPIFNLIA